ncbi:hypothetical protein EX895_005383 [Sporisorium graminicola]|uniref:YTH domain-containing protein n=1 Tax=Sporisorium graminicola TaxID=280036 RepID=A0A4U7KS79_9BASI|nr:hypothetical protein EX895_005383 [Sporisorium graminicola]TKY85842.1 hypothetical protein EX895_005383 [Sporisorium graminicola]
MSVTPPLQSGGGASPEVGGPTSPNRWGTVSGGMRSPPPAPSSGAGVRRNHTIHGPRHHGKPRLEKHFEQPEDFTSASTLAHDASAGQSALQFATAAGDSVTSREDAALGLHASPSTRSDSAGDFVSSLTPLQALYSKSSVSRNLSLPNRHSTKVPSTLPSSATQGRSSLFNSLSAITGGSDLDEHDWEKLIHSSNALGDEHQQDPNASNSLSLQTGRPWSSSLFSHGQRGGAADSSHPASPIARPGLFADGHRRDSSASGDLFDQAARTDSQALGGSSSFLRRHQSLNHHAGRSAAHRLDTRSGDLLHRQADDVTEPPMSPYSSRTDAAFSPARHTASLSATHSPVMPTAYSKAPWNQPTQDPIGSPSRFASSFPSQNLETPPVRMPSEAEGASSLLADVGTQLSGLDLSGSSALAAEEGKDAGHSMLSNPSAPSNAADGRPLSGSRKLPQLVTNRDALQRNQRSNGASGPISAAAYVPPIGHAHSRHQSNDPSSAQCFDADMAQRFGPFTAAPAGGWLDKDAVAGRFDAGQPARGAGPDSQPWMQQQPQHAGAYPAGIDPNVMALSMALAQEQQRNAVLQAQLGARSSSSAGGLHDPHLFGMQPIDLHGGMQSIGQQLRGGAAMPASPPMGAMGHLPSRGQPFPMQQQSAPAFRPPMQAQVPSPRPPAGGVFTSVDAEGVPAATPVDPTSLALQKGYNPAPGTFDLAPVNARFFVIKSYTEDDVHKSLKYEIWASTDKGNQRLDKAFRDSAHDGPIYLFYSVNASGHFCGMAQMLTPLDYATSSNVWAQDGKWKGTFKVRWIYVKDLPNNQLRHIRLTNTPECKPVTQSRDTQELTPEAGREVLRIMAAYSAKTSLLQDFNFYEMQARGVGVQPSARPLPSSSPAVGLGGLLPRNSPQPSASPALGFAFPTSPDLGFAHHSGTGATPSPNSGARRTQLTATTTASASAGTAGTPQRPHGMSGLGLAPSPRPNVELNNTLRGDDKNGDAGAAGALPDAVSAAQVAGLAPSAF